MEKMIDEFWPYRATEGARRQRREPVYFFAAGRAGHRLFFSVVGQTHAGEIRLKAEIGDRLRSPYQLRVIPPQVVTSLSDRAIAL